MRNTGRMAKLEIYGLGPSVFCECLDGLGLGMLEGFGAPG